MTEAQKPNQSQVVKSQLLKLIGIKVKDSMPSPPIQIQSEPRGQADEFGSERCGK
jgi:hypothetical protein